MGDGACGINFDLCCVNASVSSPGLAWRIGKIEIDPPLRQYGTWGGVNASGKTARSLTFRNFSLMTNARQDEK